MPYATSMRLAVCLLSGLLVGCSGPIKTVTLKGKVVPPSTEGLTNPPANPTLSNSPLQVANLSGTLYKQDAAHLNAAGEFSFELRTDSLPAAGDFVTLAWRHPSRGGLLLERTYSLSKDQTGDLPGDLTDVSTLVTLGLESLRQTSPGQTVSPPPLLENQLIQAVSLRSRFQTRYYGYLGGSDPAPGADADLAQDSAQALFK